MDNRKEEIINEINEIEEEIRGLVSKTDSLRDKMNTITLELNEYLTFEERFRAWSDPEDGTHFTDIIDLRNNCPLVYAHVNNFEPHRYVTYHIFDDEMFNFVGALTDPGIWDEDEEMEHFTNEGEPVSEAKKRILALCEEIYDNDLISYKHDW